MEVHHCGGLNALRATISTVLGAVGYCHTGCATTPPGWT
jgi:hypothetical protein